MAKLQNGPLYFDEMFSPILSVQWPILQSHGLRLTWFPAAEKRGRESLLLPDSGSDTVLKHVLCKSFRLDSVAGPG